MKYFKKVKGGRIYLSPLNANDVELYVKWLNDPEVAVTLGAYGFVCDLMTEKKYIEERKTDGSGVDFAIVLNENDRLIGNISLMDIDHNCRSALMGMFIGEEDYRGKGYGSEAIRLLLGYGFDTLNLHNVMLNVYACNTRGIACYAKSGFKEFGRRREAVFLRGKYYDVICMDILEYEYREFWG